MDWLLWQGHKGREAELGFDPHEVDPRSLHSLSGLIVSLKMVGEGGMEHGSIVGHLPGSVLRLLSVLVVLRTWTPLPTLIGGKARSSSNCLAPEDLCPVAFICLLCHFTSPSPGFQAALL